MKIDSRIDTYFYTDVQFEPGVSISVSTPASYPRTVVANFSDRVPKAHVCTNACMRDPQNTMHVGPQHMHLAHAHTGPPHVPSPLACVAGTRRPAVRCEAHVHVQQS